MRVVRSLFKIIRVVALLLAAVVDWWVRRPRVGAEGAVWIHGWCRRIVKVVGVEWRVVGELPTCGAVVSNHLSYLDVLLYSAVRPFVMVAKSEVRGWPLFGWLTSRAGTVYVTRGGGPSTYPAVNAAMAEAYRSGLPVLFFPEGTTTDGAEVLPFRRGLFHSVLNEGVPLRVAALRYSLEDASGSVEEDVCWWGDALLAPHLWRLLGLRDVRAEICFGGEVAARRDRFVLSERAREAVGELYAGSEVAGEVELVEAF
ncbi:lyso-ornithine lipid acyltransferase [Edaphobacter aggregans]|uniref:Lyso-ornithine lipid acyltransferase n=1 Tax=Edaphobacter aggregans TaxID=570835 RepID=A0A3R9Q7K5_9BACT|nr:lyso-ornithine lipid acyltransferase [Edaphobacter aggregans]